MNIFKSISALVLFLVGLPLSSMQNKGWQGIIPLHSTRTDVERLLGPPKTGGSVSIYGTRTGLVEIDYASAPCKGRVLGWNVSTDTVLEISVAPQSEERVSVD